MRCGAPCECLQRVRSCRSAPQAERQLWADSVKNAWQTEIAANKGRCCARSGQPRRVIFSEFCVAAGKSANIWPARARQREEGSFSTVSVDGHHRPLLLILCGPAPVLGRATRHAPTARSDQWTRRLVPRVLSLSLDLRDGASALVSTEPAGDRWRKVGGLRRGAGPRGACVSAPGERDGPSTNDSSRVECGRLAPA